MLTPFVLASREKRCLRCSSCHTDANWLRQLSARCSESQLTPDPTCNKALPPSVPESIWPRCIKAEPLRLAPPALTFPRTHMHIDWSGRRKRASPGRFLQLMLRAYKQLGATHKLFVDTRFHSYSLTVFWTSGFRIYSSWHTFLHFVAW